MRGHTTRLGDWLKRQLEERNLTARGAAIYAGLSHGTLSRIVRNLDPDIATLDLMADWGNVSLGYLLDLMGYQVGETAKDKIDRAYESDPELQSLLERTAKLTNEKRNSLTTFLAFLESQ